MSDNQPNTRKAYREAKAAESESAQSRDRKRQQVERDFAKQQAKAKRPQPNRRFDDVTYKKVNSLKKKLNWAIGIVLVLIVVVALVLFLL